MAPDRMGPRERVALVLLDSNILMYMAAGIVAPSMLGEAVGFKAKLATTAAVVEELKRLSESHPRPKVRRRARAALDLVARLGLEILDYRLGDADDTLEAAALDAKGEGLPVFVATSDRTLRRRLRRHGVPSIYYRESSGRLEAEWEPLL